jgi:hypothetical protein
MTEATVQPINPATTASPDTSTLHARFRDIHRKLVDASKPGAQITRTELQNLTREMGKIQHALQSTSATGPKRQAAAKKTKEVKAPSEGVSNALLDELD